MTEATGFEAKTIHGLLEVDPKSGGFKRAEDNPLDCDPLVVDEASMVDVMLMQALMRAVPDKAALLIVGDIDLCGHSQPEGSPTRHSGRSESCKM
jgi:exodeoxyribonuclease V alpha subunit